MATVTKPVALDETLQSTNSALATQTGKLNDIVAKLQLIATALGNPELIGDTDISGIADGTITGAIAEIDGDVTDLQEDMLTAQNDIDNMQDALSDDVVTVTNNPISITTLSAQYAQSTKINIEPIQEGSGDPSPSNIRPITGSSSTSLEVCGTNLLQITAQTSTISNVRYTVNDDGTVTAKPTATLSAQSMLDLGIVTFKAGKVYTLSGCPAGGNTGVTYVLFARGKSSVGFEQKIDSGTGITFGITQDVTTTITIIFYSGYSFTDEVLFRPMISLRSDSAFEKYKSSTNLTFNFGQAVFGGNLDVESGKLTVTMENIASYAGETLPGVWISDRDTYAPEATPTTGAQVVYEISTPYIIQLAGSQVELLKGLNNVISDGDSITLTYRDGEVATLADVVDLDKKIDASGSSGHVYSINEQIVGTWIDNKPLYETTTEITNPTLTNTGNEYYTNISFSTCNITNPDTIFIEKAYEVRSNGTIAMLNYADLFNANYGFLFPRTQSSDFYYASRQSSIDKIVIIARYTKTTD